MTLLDEKMMDLAIISDLLKSHGEHGIYALVKKHIRNLDYQRTRFRACCVSSSQYFGISPTKALPSYAYYLTQYTRAFSLARLNANHSQVCQGRFMNILYSAFQVRLILLFISFMSVHFMRISELFLLSFLACHFEFSISGASIFLLCDKTPDTSNFFPVFSSFKL